MPQAFIWSFTLPSLLLWCEDELSLLSLMLKLSSQRGCVGSWGAVEGVWVQGQSAPVINQ
jgi:hypothetical protein